MLPIKLTQFTNPDVLNAITPKHLARFFDLFKHDVPEARLPRPDQLAGTDGYADTWIEILKSPESLPDSFLQALLAIEALAAPENRALMDAKLAEARPAHPGLDPVDSPECLALHLWLLSPYKFTEGQFTPDADYQVIDGELIVESVGGARRSDSPRPSDGRGIKGEGQFMNSPLTSGPILPSVNIDFDARLTEYFMPHQVAWILGEDDLHARQKPVFALAEKSVRIGWTYCDAFKNVRKRLRCPNRDYLFATKDYPSALEYMQHAHEFARLLNFTRAIVAHGEDYLKVPRLDAEGRPTPFEEEIKVSYIKFDNKSRILAFSASPQAMSVYGGDVGLDEFAKHPNAQLLWKTAQARVTWNYDMAVWSSHEGEDTLFNQFAQQARAGRPPWNLYYRVTILDAIELGLLDVINRTRGTSLSAEQFIADCEARAGLPETYQQSYMCNPVQGGSGIVEWSAIERCRSDYQIERVHLEASQVRRQFGEFNPSSQHAREKQIVEFIRKSFPKLLDSRSPHRLGFDVAASGEGDLAAFYIDEPFGPELWLRALLTVRTEDWHFLTTVLYFFLKHLSRVQAAGDESGLGRQICWEAAKHFSSRFLSVNLATKKHDLGFALMNQLSVAEKRFPKSQLDIAQDFFALRKSHTGTKWVFSEGRNTYNTASHCDIAWAGALASEANNQRQSSIGAAVLHEHGIVTYTSPQSETARMILSDDPNIWKRLV